ncbi:MAG TPA: T9SS type A sorting domain-containing protein [Cryomorphaceae bacterium]|nr:T9SS type A sorting domain-containing protein [Cryomorphaceae bacterium]
MKLKIYFASALSIFALTGVAQKSDVSKSETTATNKAVLMEDTKAIVLNNEAKGNGELEVYWSEDFSNGFAGEGDNGEWTTEGAQGDYWFVSYPIGAPDGYDPQAPLTTTDAYGDIIPNFMNNIATIPSTTADNGFMMLDADRFNSIATEVSEQGAASLTSNPVDAILTSPAIDLTGYSSGLLSFWQQWRMCCSDYNITVQFSTDNGQTYASFDLFFLSGGEGNITTSSNFGINISDILSSASDLTECRIRFIWDPSLVGGATHYYAMFDDVQVVSVPDNDIAIGDTYFNNFFESPAEESDLDYIRKFEYWNQPEYITRPFNFAAGVTNNGGLEQTDVTLIVTPFLDGEPLAALPPSDPITLGVGATDTLRIYDQTPTWWENPAPGVYTFEYEVVQAADDARPDDNVGVTRSTRISTDAGNDGFAFMENDRNAFTNFYPDLGDDVIWGNRFVFTEADVESGNAAYITHIEFVLSGSESAPSTPGEFINLNVRTGSVLTEENEDNPMFRYFAEDEIEYVIQEEDLSSGNTNWISIELPTPILITPDVIYQGEAQVPPIGFPAVIHAQSNLQEPGAGVLYDFAEPSTGPQGWFTLGDLVPLIRFRTTVDELVSTDDVTYESGVKLTQNYPNPVVDNTMIQFQLDETSEVTFEVFDITGKIVYQKDYGNVPAMVAQVISFDGSALASGTYTYSIVTDNERVSRKMTIQ